MGLLESLYTLIMTRGSRPCLEGCTCGRHFKNDDQRRKTSNTMRGRTYSKERRQKNSETKLGVKRKPFTDETRRRMSEKAKNMSLEHREGISRGVKKSYLEGRRELPFPRSSSVGYHNGVKMRCLNSEGVFAQELDKVGIQWQYEPKRFNLGWTTYTPDFYLPEFDIWVEVKGWMSELAQQKINELRAMGKTVVIVWSEELPTEKYMAELSYS